jgi:hypothetical protein
MRQLLMQRLITYWSKDNNSMSIFIIETSYNFDFIVYLSLRYASIDEDV